MASTQDEHSVATSSDIALRAKLNTWDREKLIDYAISVTHSISDERGQLKHLHHRYSSTQNWVQGLALVEEIGQNLSSTLDLNEVLHRLLKRVYDAIDVADGSILLIEEPSGDLVSQVVIGSISGNNKPFRVPRGYGIAGEVALTGVPIVVNNAQEDSRHFKGIDQDTGFLTESILCVPLVTRDKIIGVLEVFNKRSGPFTESDQMMLSSIANYAAIAIENARLHQSVIEDRDRVIRAQEDVSRQLQRDLHDGPTQLVAAIQMSIDHCKRALEHKRTDIVSDELTQMYELAQRSTHQMRTLLFELRPLVLETHGLVAALQTFVERRQKDQRETELHLICKSGQADGEISRLSHKAEAAIFAIIQEAVNNALKYAKANHVFINLTENNDLLRVVVLDDGVGFDVTKVLENYEERGSYGMVNLRDRVQLIYGEYTLKSAIGGGTELTITAPISRNQ